MAQQVSPDVAERIIAMFRDNWSLVGTAIEEPFSEPAAVEIALNELIDYARIHDMEVLTPCGEEIRDVVVEGGITP
jgi:hypothetical protein